MAQTKKNILLVVEGEKEEPKLVSAIFKAYKPDSSRMVYPYRTNVHDLVQKIVNEYDGDFENINIRSVLAEMVPEEDDTTRDMLLHTRFTDVILMFDFDPQDNRFDASELRKMMETFNDSTDTDRGLILLNYPSVEAVKASAVMSYEEYTRSFVAKDEIETYKELVSETVGKLGKQRHFNFDCYTSFDFTRSIAHTVGKIQHTVGGIALDKTIPYTRTPSLSDVCAQVSQINLYDYQIAEYAERQRVSVCATGTFFIAMFASSLDGAWKSIFGE